MILKQEIQTSSNSEFIQKSKKTKFLENFKKEAFKRGYNEKDEVYLLLYLLIDNNYLYYINNIFKIKYPSITIDDVNDFLENFSNEFNWKNLKGCFHLSLKEIPRCPICNNICKYDDHKQVFYKTCSNRECVISKTKSTNIERYGSVCPMQNEDVKKTAVKNQLEKYGVENISQLDSIKAKKEATFMEHYGYRTGFLVPEIQERIKQTNLEKYGYENPLLNPEIMSRSRMKYYYDNTCFDSSWELAFYIYHKDNNIPIEREPFSYNFSLEGSDKEYHYYPDFKVNDQIIEIKGDMLVDKEGNIKPYPGKIKDLEAAEDYEAINILYKFCEKKTQIIKENNVLLLNGKEIKPYLDYVKNTYEKIIYSNLKLKRRI